METNKELKSFSLHDLEKIIHIILNNVRSELSSEFVQLNHDYYQDIDLENFFDVSCNETEFLIGQLYDDWEFLQRILKDNTEGTFLMLEHVVPLLRYICYKMLNKP